MMIGELAKATQTTKDTLRHYEQLGLLNSKERQAGSRIYKEYGIENIDRIEMIRLGKYLGFTLNEMAQQIKAYYAQGISQEEQLDLLIERKNDAQAKIERFTHVVRYLDYKIELLKGNDDVSLSRECQQLREKVFINQDQQLNESISQIKHAACETSDPKHKQ